MRVLSEHIWDSGGLGNCAKTVEGLRFHFHFFVAPVNFHCSSVLLHKQNNLMMVCLIIIQAETYLQTMFCTFVQHASAEALNRW